VIGDQALVQAGPDGASVLLRAVILRTRATELWLGLRSPDRRLDTLRAGQLVRLTIPRDGSALIGESTFLGALGGSRSRVFALVRPAGFERVQRRGYVRYPIDLPVHFRRLDPSTWEPRGRTTTTITRNLSPGGLLFLTDATVKVGDDLDLTLPLAGLDRLSMSGVVRRSNRTAGEVGPNPGGKPPQAEVAVMFTRITSLDRDHIVRLILLTEHRRRIAATAPAPASV
jgi:c-di-GMP-binding flagellar brake protein YcgR